MYLKRARGCLAIGLETVEHMLHKDTSPPTVFPSRVPSERVPVWHICELLTLKYGDLTQRHAGRKPQTHRHESALARHAANMTDISLNGSAGARPAQQKEAHIHGSTALHTHWNLCARSEEDELRNTIKGKSLYEAFQKLHFRSKW